MDGPSIIVSNKVAVGCASTKAALTSANIHNQINTSMISIFGADPYSVQSEAYRQNKLLLTNSRPNQPIGP
jgi:hypothetical protein